MSLLDPKVNAKATARLLLAELIADGQERGAAEIDRAIS